MKKIGEWDFDLILADLNRSTLPQQIGDLAQKDFKDNFDKQAFNGVPWKDPLRKKYGKGSKRTNPTLTESGALRKSIKVIQANWTKIEVATVGNKVNSYASVHNDGEGNMPKRKFMGETQKLNADIQNLIEKELDKIFKK